MMRKPTGHSKRMDSKRRNKIRKDRMLRERRLDLRGRQDAIGDEL